MSSEYLLHRKKSLRRNLKVCQKGFRRFMYVYMHVYANSRGYKTLKFQILKMQFILIAETFVFTDLKGHTLLKVTVVIRSLGVTKDEPWVKTKLFSNKGNSKTNISCTNLWRCLGFFLYSFTIIGELGAKTHNIHFYSYLSFWKNKLAVMTFY